MYQALYRKYRPQTFSDVVGQEHVTETLRNAVKSGRLSHAYLSPVLAERAKPPVPKFSQKRSTVKIPWTAIRAENVPPAAV